MEPQGFSEHVWKTPGQGSVRRAFGVGLGGETSQPCVRSPSSMSASSLLPAELPLLPLSYLTLKCQAGVLDETKSPNPQGEHCVGGRTLCSTLRPLQLPVIYAKPAWSREKMGAPWKGLSAVGLVVSTVGLPRP